MAGIAMLLMRARTKSVMEQVDIFDDWIQQLTILVETIVSYRRLD